MTFEELQRDHPECFESAFKRIKHEALARMLDNKDMHKCYFFIGQYLYTEFEQVKHALEKELEVL